MLAKNKAKLLKYVCVTVAIGAQAAITAIGTAVAGEAPAVTTSEQLIEHLRVQPGQHGMFSRGIVVHSTAGKGQGRVALSTIQFEHDSAILTADSVAQLRELGNAMRDERLSGDEFVVEGHTDAYGDAAYNKALSLRRARAVRDYLCNESGISPARLEVVGKGESQPRTDDPYAPENRRVEIVNKKVYQ